MYRFREKHQRNKEERRKWGKKKRKARTFYSYPIYVSRSNERRKAINEYFNVDRYL